MSSAEQPDQSTLEQTKQQIRGLVHEIAQLAKSELSPERFYAEFLQRVVSALAAVGGAIWLADEQRRLKRAYQINISEPLLESDSDDAQQHMRLLQQVMAGGEPVLVPPMSGTAEEGAGGNPTRYLLIMALLRSDSQVEGIIEIFQRSDSSPTTQRGYLRFVLQMCELAAEWFKSRKLRDYSDRQSLWGQADQFSRLVHESLDVPLTSYMIVNEGRRLIECDRVSLAVKKGGKCKIVAISGQDTIDQRSNIVATLRNLANRVVAADEPLWYTGSTENLPPQVEEALEEYVEESHSKTVAVLPLHRPLERRHSTEAEAAEHGPSGITEKAEVIGALIIEQIESNVPREALAVRTHIVYEHSGRALANSLRYHQIPLMPVWRLMAKSRWLWTARNLPKTVTALIALVFVGLALAFVPWDFQLSGKGELQPRIQREVFVELEGTVDVVHVKHGDKVTKGQVLAEQRNLRLEQEITEVEGKMRRSELEGQSVDLQISSMKAPTQQEVARLNGQKKAALADVRNFARQIELLRGQAEKLKIKSPIDGVVVTWKIDELVLNRPVNAGQVLMTVADPNGPWEINLFMPENRMGHVERWLLTEKPKEPLTVHYVSASEPGRQLIGKLREVSNIAEMHEEDGHMVRLRVDINSQDLENPKPGATVTAKVDCGRTSIGYAKLHEVWEAVQLAWFKYIG